MFTLNKNNNFRNIKSNSNIRVLSRLKSRLKSSNKKAIKL